MMTDGRPVHVVSTTARMKAAPERVYRIIADYRNGHPQILPKQFSNLCVDAGGYGAGTVIRFSMTVMGSRINGGREKRRSLIRYNRVFGSARFPLRRGTEVVVTGAPRKRLAP